jgi:hypothetical protein
MERDYLKAADFGRRPVVRNVVEQIDGLRTGRETAEEATFAAQFPS